ncbi:MAG: peptidoglycan DD-metalloendopeptidase family protein [Spirulinaceae cyanobacterium]
MSPRLAKNPNAPESSPSLSENTSRPAPVEALRRPRSSTMLSLAALSMGATAGVLLSGHGEEARAAEPDLTQRPLSFEASGNPFAAADTEVTSTPEVTPDNTSIAAQPEIALKPELVQNPQVLEHTIQNGDTLWTLSQTYQVSADAIVAANPINSDTVLQPGARIRIPHSASASIGVSSNPTRVASASTPTAKSEPSKIATDEALELESTPLDKAQSRKTTPKVIAPSQSAQPNSEIAPESGHLAATSAPEVALTQPIPLEVETPEFEPPSNFSAPVVIPVPPPQTAAADSASASESPETDEIALEIPTPNDKAIALQEDNNLASISTALTTPQLLVPIAEAAKVYRVQSGDTIDEIALRYGVSRSDLTEVNRLSDPHQIRVNQELQIPQPQSRDRDRTQYETLIPNSAIAPSNDRLETQTNNNDVVVPTETLISQTVESISDWQPTAVPERETVEVAPTTSENSAANPYVERLKADIERLREEYRNRNDSEPPSETPLSNLSGSRSATPATTTVATAIEETNPEWESDSRNGFIEVRVEDRRQPLNAPQVQARPQTQPLNRDRQSVQVAVAPTAPTNYNPLLQPNNQRVEPNLPPLSPDNYLPDSPPQFDGYIWPAEGVFTSGYGRRWGRMHRGIDIAGPTGTPIVAAASGEIIVAGWNSGGYGNLVDIRHPDGSMTRYAHNSKLLVRKGQWVQQGQQIALMGSTGYSTGPHLHFEIHPNGRGAANPIAYLPGR